MDLAFVRRLSADLAAGTIVLVGPSADPDPALSELPRVVRLGAFPFERLPSLAREADVLIMPYADLPVTRAMQPLKLKEYLATGKPTVVRRLPATVEWSDCLDQADTPETFSAAVRQRLQEGLPAKQGRARTRLLRESWADKARQFEQWALAGLSLQGLMMSVIGGQFVGYASFDTVEDANRAAAILGDLGSLHDI